VLVELPDMMTVTVELPEFKDVDVIEVCCTIVVVPFAEAASTWLPGFEELGNCDDVEEPPPVEPVALVAETICVTNSCEELTGAIVVVLLPAELATSRWVEMVAELDIELEAAGAITDVLIAEALDVTDELVPIAEVVMLADVPFTSAVAIDIVADGGGGGGGSVAVDVLVVVDEKSDAGGGGIDVNVLDVVDEGSGTGGGFDVLSTLVDVLDGAVVGGGGGNCEVEELIFAVVDDDDDDDDVDNTDEVGGGGGVETLTVVVIVDEDSGRGGSCDVLNPVAEKLEAEDVERLLDLGALVDDVVVKDDEEGGGGGGGN